MKINFEIGFSVTEKRLLKLGFKPKDFIYEKKPKRVFVMGRYMDDCGYFNDIITYDPIEKEIEVFYGASISFHDKKKVESMIDIRNFLKGRDVEDHQIEFEKKYGKIDEGKTSGFDVVMINPGLSRINVMKLLKSDLNLSLQECKDFVDNTPKVIRNCFEAKEAEKLKSKFENIGAQIEIN